MFREMGLVWEMPDQLYFQGYTPKTYSKRDEMSFDGRAITLGPGEGRVVQQPGHPITFKATAEGTRGAYSLLEVVVPGNGPTQHIHKPRKRHSISWRERSISR